MKRLRYLLLLPLLLTLTACGDTAADTDEHTATEATRAEETVPVADDQPQGLRIGDTAPDFSLVGVDGKTTSLADLKLADGSAPRGYVVTFTCNTCPYAKAYEERLVALDKAAEAMGYPVVAIQPNDPGVKEGDSMENMKERAKEAGFTFPYLMDEGQRVYPKYGASKTPEIYLLDADRVLRYHGAIDDNHDDAAAVTVNYVEKAIRALQAGEAVDPAEVKAIGCSIKTKRS